MASENELNKRLARFDSEVVDLEAILIDYIKLLRVLVYGLREELVVNVPGGKIREVSVDVVRKLKDLTAALNSATDSHTRLEKVAKDKSKRMTEAESLAAAIKFLLKQPYEIRRKTIISLVTAHNSAVKEAKAAGIQGATQLTVMDIV